MLKKKTIWTCLLVLLSTLTLFATAQARPSWISVSYSDFSVHRNPNQNDINAQGYYYAKISATCVNNSSDKTITTLTNRSMGFVANATGNDSSLGIAAGYIAINAPSNFEPVGPGEKFRIEYSVPVMFLNEGSVVPFNQSKNPRLSRYKLKHNFNVQ